MLSFVDLAELMSNRAGADQRHEAREARSSARRLERKGKPGRNAHRQYISTWFSGIEALREITGNERPDRAGTWYKRFLAEHRAGAAPDGVRRSDWEAIANAWAWREVEMALIGGMSGEIVLVDKMAFGLWRGGYFVHLNRVEPTGCPEEVFLLPRGYIPHPGKKSNKPKGSPSPRSLWDKSQEGPIPWEWSKQEKAAGIPKKIAAGNYSENSFKIPEALTRQLQKDHGDQRSALKHHSKFSRETWQSPAPPPKEIADMQAEEKHAEEEEEQEGNSDLEA